MTHSEIRYSKRNGSSPTEILKSMVECGWEFPDASARIQLALSLTPKQVEEMEQEYETL